MGRPLITADQWIHGRASTYTYRGCRCELCLIASRHKYNTDPATKIIRERYQALFDLQSGRCALCNKVWNKRPLMQDHCHKTGMIRGLLCQKCNTALGLFGDSPEMIKKVLEYLESPPALKYGKDLRYRRRPLGIGIIKRKTANA